MWPVVYVDSDLVAPWLWLCCFRGFRPSMRLTFEVSLMVSSLESLAFTHTKSPKQNIGLYFSILDDRKVYISIALNWF